MRGILTVKGPIILIAALFANQSRAELDAESQRLLIDKLARVQSQLADEDPSKVPVTLRLADLLAERARKTASAGVENGAELEGDRDRAIRLYSQALERAPESARAKVLIQIGHLQQLSGHDDQAVKAYEKVLATASDSVLKSEAQLSLGEVAFKNRDYLAARGRYEQVLRDDKAASRGLAAYRRAWCLFHMGLADTAVTQMKQLLSTPELMVRSGAKSDQIDSQFQEEVSRDLAIMMAKEKVTPEKVEDLYKLSPASTRNAAVQALAGECERLGRKKEALTAYAFVIGKLDQPIDRVAARLSMAQLRFDVGERSEALNLYESAIKEWQEAGYRDSRSEQELRRRARNFPVSWNQTEKKAPSADLLAAYELFLGLFPQDLTVHLYAAQVARELQQWPVAWNHYGRARDIAQDPGELESVLLSRLEVAELAKNSEWSVQAIDDYLSRSVRKTKALEVQYQKAQALYDKGDNAAAAEMLRALALTDSGDAILRKQAAELALDALVLLRDEDRLLPWAREFEARFPGGSFGQVAQKAILTRSARLAESDPAAAYRALAEFDPAQAAPEDRITCLRNRLVLAERTGQMKEAAIAADTLLAQPGLSAQDQELAWARKAHLAEIRLDFTTAFVATGKIKTGLSPADRSLKLAVFADLSGKKSADHYVDFLRLSGNPEQRRLVAAELVRRSSRPEVEIVKLKGQFDGSPEELANLYVEVYARTGRKEMRQAVVSSSTLKGTSGGVLLSRNAFLAEFENLNGRLAAEKLDTKSSAGLARSVRRRADLLKRADELAQRAIASGDWTSQLVTIDVVGRESERFYNDLMSAPVPPGLNGEEEQQYLALLSEQAASFQSKAAEAKAKVDQFWKTEWVEPMRRSWEWIAARPLLKYEVHSLRRIAPASEIDKLSEFVETGGVPNRPTIEQLQVAKTRVFENPLDVPALEDLLRLERQAENRPMAEYLSSRLETLKKKGTL